MIEKVTESKDISTSNSTANYKKKQLYRCETLQPFSSFMHDEFYEYFRHIRSFDNASFSKI